MKSAEEVDELVVQLKKEVSEGTIDLSKAIFEVAKACVGWPYVYGARGKLTKKDGITVRSFDCRGFTYWVCLQFGIKIDGVGCTSQWNDEDNWRAKGDISNIPEDIVVCLFHRDKKKPNVMAHTGFSFQRHTCECQVGVQYFEKMKSKWQYWAVPKGIGGDIPVPTTKPTLRRGDKGEYVTLLQTMLIQRGYDLTPWGADGSFGAKTEEAVKLFQIDSGLASDGIVGKKTWAALESGETHLFTVCIPHLSQSVADEIVSKYGGTMTKEGGA